MAKKSPQKKAIVDKKPENTDKQVPVKATDVKAPDVKATEEPKTAKTETLQKTTMPENITNKTNVLQETQEIIVPPLPEHTKNPYIPYEATVQEVIRETANIMTFRVTFDDPEVKKNFKFEPGQVGQLSFFGAGESTFVINSPPTRMDYIQFSVMKVGEVTSKLHTIKAGDKVGVRAPLGNSFPYEKMKGKDIVFVGGGIGMAPLRTLLLYMLDNRKDYGKITLLYGARSPQDMAYIYETEEWLKRDDLNTVLTIDREAEGWQHKVGLIPNVLLEINPDPKNTVAITCGPPIMIKFTLQALKQLKFEDSQIYTTLEKRMKCGIGICGRCNIGTKYVCMDGPVFSYDELKDLPNEL
ncbi:NAD(P)H-flavin reductase [Desulfovibrio litoralis DSM 11393]|uniref:NAD(P)H-flavin reductase n=1 Tax=Desulfovibrio litoralis DSM 11393 TaxID=1121455 RepID=A0A1M7T8V1_9BACT|nr:NAD(P)H-flavin reductase [Desulfovibrio litoralis DSM 11393]